MINGTVYSVTSSGVFTTLHTFTGTDGQGVYAPLVQGTDGNFYGDTVYEWTEWRWRDLQDDAGWRPDRAA